MSNFALLTKIKEMGERLHRVEMATIYKVGFWGCVVQIAYKAATYLRIFI